MINNIMDVIQLPLHDRIHIQPNTNSAKSSRPTSKCASQLNKENVENVLVTYRRGKASWPTSSHFTVLSASSMLHVPARVSLSLDLNSTCVSSIKTKHQKGSRQSTRSLCTAVENSPYLHQYPHKTSNPKTRPLSNPHLLRKSAHMP
jgi:hypothetical protein